MRTEWKIGELAEATGLTVRTLHHWDHQGLVTPSARTASGHRRYAEDDVRRVYEVVALRGLGLPLEQIARVLADGLTGFGDVLAAHLDAVRAQLSALRALEANLAGLVDGLQRTDLPSTTDLLRLIDEVSTMTETFRNYLTDEQLATLQARREEVGDEHILAVEKAWPPLIAQVQAAMEAGTDPAEPHVQELARQWMALLEEFDGGDRAIRAGMTQMLTDNECAVTQHGGPPLSLIEYIKRANAAGR